MKIELIGINSSYVHTNLAIRQIKANCNYDIGISDYNINMDIEEVLYQIYEKKADLIGFSCYIWNINYVLFLGENLKKISPKTILVLGGPEVSFENQSYDCADYIIPGECENSFNAFLENNFKIDHSYNVVKDLNNLKLFCEEYDKDKIYYYESTRGCPFSCTYCLSGSIGCYREKNLDLVKHEIDIFIKKNARLVKLVDRTFNANIKRAKEIFKYIIKHSNNTMFHFEVALDLFDDELIEILHDADNKIQMESGVQTTNKTTLKMVNRITDIEKVLHYAELVPKKVHLHLDLIAGLPMENYMSFQKSFNRVYKTHPDNLQIGFLKVLKGSQIKKDDPTMIYRHYPPYEILKTDYLSVAELFEIKKIEYVFDKYYNKKKAYLALDFAQTNSNETPFGFYLSFTKYFYDNEYNKRPQSLKGYFKILAAYAKTILNKDLYIDFLCKLKLDYMKANMKDVMEEFNDITPDIDSRHYYEIVKQKVMFTPHQLRNACISGFIKNPVTLEHKNCIIVLVNGELTIF